MRPYYPFFPPARKHCYHRVDRHGIPYEKVIQVTEEATRVVFKIPCNDLKELPANNGAMILAVKNLPVITDDTLPVFIDDGCRVKPLYYDLNVQMTASEFQAGHYYWFFYDKCDNVIILMNAEATPAPTSATVTGESTVVLGEGASAQSTQTAKASKKVSQGG